MRAAVISLGSVSSQWTAKAMRTYFSQVDELDIRKIDINFSGGESEVLYDGKPIKKYDCILAKGSFRYAQILSSVTAILEKQCYMPFRSTAFSIGHDKLLSQLTLHQFNIPMPKTYLSATPDAGKEILKKVNYPIVMKFPQGTQGKGVMFADSFVSASSMLDALSAIRQSFIIQEYVETEGMDIRVIVVGDQVIGAYKRIAQEEERRSNIHAGGKGEAYTPDEVMKKIAVKAAKAVGADICGIDILPSMKGPVVLEVNLSPGLQGIKKYANIDVADAIAKHCFDVCFGRNAKKKKAQVKAIMENVDSEKSQQLILSLDFRANRILLPELITKITKFREDVSYLIKVGHEQLQIKEYDVNNT